MPLFSWNRPGKCREIPTVPVMISGSTHIPPQPYLIEKQMEDFILRFKQMEKEKVHPVLIAAYLHDELVGFIRL